MTSAVHLFLGPRCLACGIRDKGRKAFGSEQYKLFCHLLVPLGFVEISSAIFQNQAARPLSDCNSCAEFVVKMKPQLNVIDLHWWGNSKEPPGARPTGEHSMQAIGELWTLGSMVRFLHNCRCSLFLLLAWGIIGLNSYCCSGCFF